MTVQLSLNLAPLSPYGLNYFVVHSGVTEGYRVLADTLAELLNDPSQFKVVVIQGGSGSGKTHLLQGFRHRGLEQGVAADKIVYFDLSAATAADSESIGASTVSAFIDRYEELKANGGLLLVELRSFPSGRSEVDPHLTSRLLAGLLVTLRAPLEEELPPIISSIAERKNLKLSTQSVDYLLKRVPINGGSFADVVAEIERYSLENGRAASSRVIRQLIERGV